MDRQAREKESAQENEKVITKPRFLRKRGYWYFSEDSGRLIGPFDKIHEAVLGEWRNTERVLTGSRMSDVLAPYVVAVRGGGD